MMESFINLKMSTHILHSAAQLYNLQARPYFKPISQAKILRDDFLAKLFSFFASQVIPRACHHNNPQPAIHSWNRYRERQKGDAFDVPLQGSSLTSLSPPGELWASYDLRHCQLGCKQSSCLRVLLACGSPVRHFTSLCVFYPTPHPQIRTGGRAPKLSKNIIYGK